MIHAPCVRTAPCRERARLRIPAPHGTRGKKKKSAGPSTAEESRKACGFTDIVVHFPIAV